MSAALVIFVFAGAQTLGEFSGVVSDSTGADLRWRIEFWYRILNSGCKVEYSGRRMGQRIERALAMRAVIAWRLAALALLGRETPSCRPRCSSPKSRCACCGTSQFVAGWTLRATGGYQCRKNAPPPGHQRIWEGWTRLTTMTEACELRGYFEPPEVVTAEGS